MALFWCKSVCGFFIEKRHPLLRYGQILLTLQERFYPVSFAFHIILKNQWIEIWCYLFIERTFEKDIFHILRLVLF